MDKALEQEVRNRAHDSCEYCQLPESISELRHSIDHIIARQHQGQTVSDNLALCCGRCNRHKGPNLSGIDPQIGKMSRLFNPRMDDWRGHFRWSGALLLGLTSIGRATIEVLCINHKYRVAARRVLIASGKLRLQ